MIITESHLEQSFNTEIVSLATERTKRKQFSESTAKDKTIVFLSHKHDDIKQLKQTIRLLKNCSVDIYIDWMDEKMPKKTCAKTAERLKEKIKNCDRFVFIGTEGAIDSKWCNWELGQGDVHKFEESELAILPIKKDYEDYSGNEYIEIYPTIQYENGSSKYIFKDKDKDDGMVFYVHHIKSFDKPTLGYIPRGYYVQIQHVEDGNIIKISVRLKDWLKK